MDRRIWTWTAATLILSVSIPMAGCRRVSPENEDVTTPIIQDASEKAGLELEQGNQRPPAAGVISWSAEEEAYINRIEEVGVLPIVTRVRESVYEPNRYGPGLHGGMEYLLASGLAESLGVHLEVSLVDSFSDYFAHDGAPPDEATQAALVSGTVDPWIPDLFRNGAILVDGFGWRKWREPLGLFIPTTPDRDVIIVRNDSSISSPEDLAGRTVAVARSSAYVDILKELETDQGVALEWIVLDDTGDQARWVAEGRADATVIGGISAMFEIQKYQDLHIAFPIGDRLEWSHWIVASDDAVLAGIVKKYLKAARRSGYYAWTWNQQFAFPYDDFIRALGVGVQED